MRLDKAVQKVDMAELCNEVLEILGFLDVPTELLPPLEPILEAIAGLGAEPEAGAPLLVAIPHRKLRDRVLYRDVSVFRAMEALLKTRPVESWDQLSLTVSPGMEMEDEVLLWNLTGEEAYELLAEGKEVLRPLEGLSLRQLCGVELVGGKLHDAAILIAKYLLEQGEAWEWELEFMAIRKLAEKSYRELGYEDLPEEPHQSLYTAWNRYRRLRAWQTRTAETVLRHFRKE